MADIYKVINPTVYLARCYGLVPFSFERKEIRYIYFIVTAVDSMLYFWGITKVYNSMYNNTILPKFEKLMLILQVTATSSVTISSWMANLFRFKKIIDIFEDIKNVEKLLHSLDMDVDVRYRKKIQYYFIFGIAFLSLQNLLDNIFLGENIIALFIIYTIAMLTLSHFLLLICMCRNYYAFINNKLKSLGELSPEGLTDIVKLSEEILQNRWARRIIPFQERLDFLNILTVTTECHSELYRICNKINKYFGLQILLNVTANILNVTSICYYVPAIVIDQTDKPHHYMILSIKSVLFIALGAFIQLWIMAYICSATSGEIRGSSYNIFQANSVGIIIHGMMNQPKFSIFIEQLDTFSTQLLHQRVKFTAYGFFIIDFSLINTVTGVVITYIVILIQFQMSNES